MIVGVAKVNTQTLFTSVYDNVAGAQAIATNEGLVGGDCLGGFRPIVLKR